MADESNTGGVRIGVARERRPGERRIPVTPETCRKLIAAGARIAVERGAGHGASIDDDALAAAGAVIAPDAATAFEGADIVLCIHAPPADALARAAGGALVVGQFDPEDADDVAGLVRARGMTVFPLQRLPRTTRAQAMDVLSSQAGMAGYKAMLLAATLAPRFFPMLTTAAGTIRPSKVLVVGAGVAGLQAIATARRLGAQVEGFDVRPETREQIESLGARFLDLGVSAAGEGGYARQLTDEERAAQQRALAEHLKSVDVVVTTAAVPGRPAPRIVSDAMVAGMRPGSVVVDLAAESGGNCESTRAGETVEVHGVTVAGPRDLASMGAVHASEMFARNLMNFVSPMLGAEGLDVDWNDDLVAATAWPPREPEGGGA